MLCYLRIKCVAAEAFLCQENLASGALHDAAKYLQVRFESVRVNQEVGHEEKNNRCCEERRSEVTVSLMIYASREYRLVSQLLAYNNHRVSAFGRIAQEVNMVAYTVGRVAVMASAVYCTRCI